MALFGTKFNKLSINDFLSFGDLSMQHPNGILLVTSYMHDKYPLQ